MRVRDVHGLGRSRDGRSVRPGWQDQERRGTRGQDSRYVTKPGSRRAHEALREPWGGLTISQVSAPAQSQPSADFRPAKPLVIGLCGGIAAGKSAVAAAFAARGLRHVDADRLAREVSARPDILAAMVDRFGPAILDAQGTLDRKSLAQRVFADPTARKQLEAITHPPVRAAIRAELEAAKKAGASVLLDIPLLLESGWALECDHVIFVHASDAVRAARAATRGWDDRELARREAAQAPLPEKRACARFVIDNDGTRDAMARQVDAILQQLAGMA